MDENTNVTFSFEMGMVVDATVPPPEDDSIPF